MVELNDLINKQALLIHEQGETCNSIEAHIDKSAIAIEEGAEELSEGSKYVL